MNNYNPNSIVTELNTHIVSESDEKMFVTLFYAVIDASTKKMCYTNAGHNYPLIFHEDGEHFESLEDGGLLMGMFEEASYQEKTIQLKRGDVVVFYTDGIVEAMNPDDEMLGFDRLKEMILKYKHESAETIRDKIIEETLEFMGESSQYDDITLIVIKINE
jgi:sigma-B regulation protein RsbU (phosphoserine phosphatase)